MTQTFDAHKSTSSNLNRREFLKFCGLMASVLALPKGHVTRIAEALSASSRLPVVWLEFQDCTGDSESFLRASERNDPLQVGVRDPSVVDLLFDYISLDYHETLMAPSGSMTEKSLTDTMQQYPGEYVCIVEGSIPTGDNGVYCTIRGRTALSIAQEVLGNARCTIALGSCAWDGGLAAAWPNPTGATGVRGAIPGLSNLICLPGCPANVINLVAVIVYLITYNELPRVDSSRRPLFAYDEEIHEECERHHHYEAGRFVLAWGDQGHRNGWCLYKMGCRGPETDHNCPTVKWNDGTCWPVAAGHGCIGCASPHFWDSNSPFYVQLPDDD